MASNDQVPCRLPYAIVTKLVELVGWKRFELNKVMRFHGVTEETFNSILRRSLCMEFKSTFVDETEFRQRVSQGKGPWSHGVFLRDPALTDFLRSGPAIASSLTNCMAAYSNTVRRTAGSSSRTTSSVEAIEALPGR